MQKLSNQEQKIIKRYHLKKYRMQEQLFLAEGKKLVGELITSQINIKVIIISDDFQEKNTITLPKHTEFRICSPEQFKKISTQKTPDGILAVCGIPQPKQQQLPNQQWVIALDTLQDPGNLGTIIRIADWFNISTILCSTNTVDAYNPKVVQSSMGSIARVTILYRNLQEELSNYNGIIYGATLQGESIYSLQQQEPGILVIGNESNGISEQVSTLLSKQITIPRLGEAESLNAGIAAAILTSHLLQP